MEINFDDFEVIKPVAKKQVRQIVSIYEDGGFTVNKALLQVIGSRFEVRMKPDATQMLLIPGGTVLTDVGKNGRMKNYGPQERIAKRKMKFPVYYVGEWNEEKKCWVGDLTLSNPNKTKRIVK